MMSFHDRLISELTRMDERASKRPGHNPWALPQYFAAADAVVEAIAAGESESRAFADAFNPTRGMHTIARRLELNLDVDRGRWIVHEVPVPACPTCGRVHAAYGLFPPACQYVDDGHTAYVDGRPA